MMSWLSSDTHSYVACDAPGCTAAIGHHPYRAADALARAWVNIVGPLWICPPCDVAPRCRACDGITRAEGVRLCDRCERDGQGVIGGAQ